MQNGNIDDNSVIYKTKRNFIGYGIKELNHVQLAKSPILYSCDIDHKDAPVEIKKPYNEITK